MSRLRFVRVPVLAASKRSLEGYALDPKVRRFARTAVTTPYNGTVTDFTLIGDRHDPEATLTVYANAVGMTFGVSANILTANLSATTTERLNVLLEGVAKVMHYARHGGKSVRTADGSFHRLPIRVDAWLADGTKVVGGTLIRVMAAGSDPFQPVVLDTLRKYPQVGREAFPVVMTPASTPPAVPYVPGTPVTAPAPAFVEPAPAPVVRTPDPVPTPARAPLVVDNTPVSMPDPLGLFRFPTPATTASITTDPQVGANLDLLWKMHRAGKRQVLALVGPTGTGKTSIVYDLAARNGVGVFTFDAAGARDFSDWVGTTHLEDGKTAFLPSGFLQAIDADGPYAGKPRIVLIDEVNRAESSGSLNALIPVLHGFGSIYVPEMGRSVSVDPAVMVAMTANRGSSYAGTVAMDLALSDRVTAWVRLNGLSHAAEVTLLHERTGITLDEANALVTVAESVRRAVERGEVLDGGGISTRRLLTAAEKVAAGFTLHAAATLSWLDSYNDEGGTSSERSIVAAAIDSVLMGR